MVSNWAGNVSFSAARFHQPSSVSDVRRLVAEAGRVKALGTGHSFNRIADTPGDLISLERLPTIIAVDPDRSAVTISADVTYGELAPRLHDSGFALANLGSLPHISVAGACATGTHGSGDGLGNLASAVSAIDLVTADGGLVTLERGQPDFDGAVVSLGALGIVVRLTLDIEPTYYLHQHVYDGLPVGSLDEHFGAIFAAGYSVSLFTGWQGPVITQVWVKERLPAGDPRAELHGPGWPTAPSPGPRHVARALHAPAGRRRPVAQAAAALPVRPDAERRAGASVRVPAAQVLRGGGARRGRRGAGRHRPGAPGVRGSHGSCRRPVAESVLPAGFGRAPFHLDR